MFALVVLGCNDPVAVQGDALRVHRDGEALVLENRSSAPVYTFMAERGILARLDWVPCDDPATCDGIASGASRRVAFRDITGYTDVAREVVIYHWHLVPAATATGHAPDSIRSLIFRIR